MLSEHHHDHGSSHAHHHGPEDAHGHGFVGRFTGWLRPHSHDLVDQTDAALERSTEGIRATKLTLLVLLATSAVQLVIAVVSGSVALLADMIHNVADGLTSLPLWLAFVLGRRAANGRYPYGYRRAEDLAGVFIVLTIAVSAVIVGWESVSRLIDPQPLSHLGWVFLAGVIGVMGNEVAAVIRIRVGHRIGSAALVADGYHARTDTMASFAVILAVIGTWLGYPIVDPLVGLVITGLICWILVQTGRQVIRRLMDGVEPEVVEDMRGAATTVDGVQHVDWVRARWTGHRLHGEVAITVDRDLTVAEGHAVAENLRHTLLHTLPHLQDTTVHVNPCGHDGDDPHAGVRHHEGR